MYSIEDYASMIGDPVRGTAYLAAVRDNVRPGHVVADIGAGPGVLGVYAAMLGARRVFLVEPDAIVDAAVELARENGVLDRIEIIRGVSTEITLPERADLIVSDLHGTLPLFEDHLRAAADMHARHLAPGGVYAPVRDVLHCALVEDADLFDRSVNGWSGLPDTMRHHALTVIMTNRWYRTHASAAAVLTEPRHWLTLEYAHPAPPLDGSWSSVATRDGVAHGLLLWFDTDLTPGNSLSNSPLAPKTVYGQAFFPFADPMVLRAGDSVTGRLRAVKPGEEYEWTWTAKAVRAGRMLASASHTTLLCNVFRESSLQRRSDAFVPRRTPQAEALHLLLGIIDGERDVQDVAAILHERLPVLFPTAREAVSYVTRHEHFWL